MSELITNLQTIYNTKLALKEAIGTVSDNFVDYPSYISGMVTPTGTYNISDNGTFDVSTYASAYVNVSGGGTEYIFFDPDADTKTTGSYYEFNGQLNSNYMMEITSDFAQAYPALEPYIGWYVYTIYGDDKTNPQSIGDWSETCIIEDTYGLDGQPVIAKGQYVELITGNPMFIIDSLEQAKYAGGNGTMNISTNGNYDMTKYSYAVVNIYGDEFNPSNISSSANGISLVIENTNLSETQYYYLGTYETIIKTMTFTVNVYELIDYLTWLGDAANGNVKLYIDVEGNPFWGSSDEHTIQNVDFSTPYHMNYTGSQSGGAIVWTDTSSDNELCITYTSSGDVYVWSKISVDTAS